MSRGRPRVTNKENVIVKVSHLISEMGKTLLQIRLFMIFTVYLMLWKILHIREQSEIRGDFREISQKWGGAL